MPRRQSELINRISYHPFGLGFRRRNVRAIARIRIGESAAGHQPRPSWRGQEFRSLAASIGRPMKLPPRT